MNHASLFSGIGGPEIAAAMLGWDNVFHCEINDFGRTILEYWFPNSESYEDIKKTDFTKWRGRVDVLTGGFPCQPFSYAGQRRGADDDRYLWPEFKRVISEVRPAWVVGENVAGITTMVEPGQVSPLDSQATLFDEGDGVRRYRQEQPFTIERVCQDLEGLGYAVQPIVVPACAVGAPHRRDRVFIVANANECADGRVSREDAGACGAERLQERNEIRIADEPDKVRREGERDAFPYASDVQLDGCERGGRGDDLGQTLSEFRSGDSEAAQRGSSADTDVQRRTKLDTTSESREEKRQHREEDCSGNNTDTDSKGLERDGREELQGNRGRRRPDQHTPCRCEDIGVAGCGRWANFPTVSPVHRGNDGLPFALDDLAISPTRWRTESLKAYGNAIVPQVMYEIFRAIELVTKK